MVECLPVPAGMAPADWAVAESAVAEWAAAETAAAETGRTNPMHIPTVLAGLTKWLRSMQSTSMPCGQYATPSTLDLFSRSALLLLDVSMVVASETLLLMRRDLAP